MLTWADDFDDFQTAPAAAPQPATAQTTAAAKVKNAGLFDLLNPALSSGPISGQHSSKPSMGIGMGMTSPPLSSAPPISRPNYISPISSASTAKPPSAPAAAGPAKSSGSTFDDLWTTSLSTISSNGVKPAGSGNAGGKSMKDMEQEQRMNQIWASGGQQAQAQQKDQWGQFGGSTNGTANGSGTSGKKGGSDFDDLLL